MLSIHLTAKEKVTMCLILNVITLTLVVCLISVFRDTNSTYFRLGPSDSLTVISVAVDTWYKWGIVVGVLSLFGIAEVIIHELGMPVLGFSVYNPDKKIINDFKRHMTSRIGLALLY